MKKFKVKTKPAKLKSASFKSKMKPKKSNPTGKWKLTSLGSLSLLFFLLPLTSFAQTVKLPVPVPSTTSIQWIHDGLNTDRFEIKVDADTYIDVGKPASADGVYKVSFPAMSPGNHTITVCAANIAGRACATPPVDVALIVIPISPNSVTIVIAPAQ